MTQYIYDLIIYRIFLLSDFLELPEEDYKKWESGQVNRYISESTSPGWSISDQ